MKRRSKESSIAANRSKESIDHFADVLQLFARKVLNVDPSFQAFMNKSLCQQLANGLKDPSHSISARSILNQQPEIQFAVFRSDLANILCCCIRAVGAKGALCNATMCIQQIQTGCLTHNGYVQNSHRG